MIKNRIQDSGFGMGEQGFSLVSAIFLLVVVAALGAFALTISTSQQQSQTLDLMGSRAYQAARAGIEWAAFNVAASPASSPAPWAGCAPGAAVVVGGNLAAFSPVAVNCTAASHVEDTATIWVYDVSAVAATAGAAPGGLNYVERDLGARLAR